MMRQLVIFQPVLAEVEGGSRQRVMATGFDPETEEVEVIWPVPDVSLDTSASIPPDTPKMTVPQGQWEPEHPDTFPGQLL